jgi:DNA repair protein RecN (Recombination protein N)
MLAELTIRDFAIIDALTMQFAPGFNVLTGETGAGKSIILDAVMLILGERADKSMVRAECDLAHVEALFQLSPAVQQAITPTLEAEGLEAETPDTLLISREVRTNGRTIARVNGRAVSQKLLEEIGQWLIDIHGQGSHLNLLRPRAHLPLLDSYGHLDAPRKQVESAVHSLRELQRELAELQQDERAMAQRRDLLHYQVEEIRAATLQPGEDDDLVDERKRLANAEQLLRYSAEAEAILHGHGEELPAVLDLLGQAERALGYLVRLDSSQEPLLERLQGLVFQLQEWGGELADYRELLEFNPERLNEVEERLELIGRLKRKYGADIPAVLAFGEQAAAQLNRLEGSEERIGWLEGEIGRRLKEIGRLAGDLSQRRQESAEKLARAIETELGDLAMTARFAVDFATRPDPHGAFVGNERLAFDSSGIDQVEFLISANPGEPLKPMARVASGGETARLMLALKTALARVDNTPTLIFDEIDQGIGGRIGEIVGRKLWGLGGEGAHQVIVVTHLPQLAGYGDIHFHVRKQVRDGRTRTQVLTLDHRQRVEELAAMLGTTGEHALGGAADLLQSAAAVKAGRLPI